MSIVGTCEHGRIAGRRCDDCEGGHALRREYLVAYYGQDGRVMEDVLYHFPDIRDIPEWACRVDVALPV